MRTVVLGPSMVGKTRLAGELSQSAFFLNLDPARQEPTPLAFASLLGPDGSLQGIRFIGGLSLASDPIATIAAVSWALANVGSQDLVCELPIDRPTPVFVHLLRRIIDVVKPDLLITVGLDAGAELIQAPPKCDVQRRDPLPGAERRPPKVTAAWRRASWLGLFAEQKPTTLPLKGLRLSGARLGSGLPIERDEMVALRSIIPGALHGEVTQQALTVVAEHEPSPEAIHAAADHFGCSTAHIVDTRAYDGLVCGFENNLGEHFSVARVETVDFEAAAVTFRSPAQPPWPVTRVHMGTLVLDAQMNEVGHVKPWQV
jgi:polynucleotide 5'-kinase involved in rRNA processing